MNLRSKFEMSSDAIAILIAIISVIVVGSLIYFFFSNIIDAGTWGLLLLRSPFDIFAEELGVSRLIIALGAFVTSFLIWRMGEIELWVTWVLTYFLMAVAAFIA